MTIYYTENAVQIPPNAPILEGKEAILSSLKKSVEEIEEYCDSSIIEDVSVHGNMAVARGTDTGTTTLKDGGEATRYNIKWLIVYERQSDGTWKCAYEIWNDNNPLPASPEEE